MRIPGQCTLLLYEITRILRTAWKESLDLRNWDYPYFNELQKSFSITLLAKRKPVFQQQNIVFHEVNNISAANSNSRLDRSIDRYRELVLSCCRTAAILLYGKWQLLVYLAIPWPPPAYCRQLSLSSMTLCMTSDRCQCSTLVTLLR